MNDNWQKREDEQEGFGVFLWTLVAGVVVAALFVAWRYL